MGNPAAAASSRRTTAPAARAASTWPFMAQVSDFGVGVPARQEVQFKDDKRIWLMRVEKDGSPDLFLRDLGAPATGTRIDLRQFIDDVEKELPTTSTRDVAGYVAISLRLRFPTLDAFIEAAIAQGRPA